MLQPQAQAQSQSLVQPVRMELSNRSRAAARPKAQPGTEKQNRFDTKLQNAARQQSGQRQAVSKTQSTKEEPLQSRPTEPEQLEAEAVIAQDANQIPEELLLALAPAATEADISTENTLLLNTELSLPLPENMAVEEMGEDTRPIQQEIVPDGRAIPVKPVMQQEIIPLTVSPLISLLDQSAEEFRPVILNPSMPGENPAVSKDMQITAEIKQASLQMGKETVENPEVTPPAADRLTKDETSQKPVQAGPDLRSIMEQESQRISGKKPVNTGQGMEQETKSSPEESFKGIIAGANDRVIAANALSREGLEEVPQNKAPADAKDLVDQLVKKMEVLQRQNLSEMKIQLKPEILGKMTIKIMVEEGVVTARFITDNHQVKQILEANMANLKQNLEASGLRVEKTEVNVALDNGSSFQGQDGREGLWQQANTHSRSPVGRNVENYGPGLAENIPDEEIFSSPGESYGIQDGRVDFMV